MNSMTDSTKPRCYDSSPHEPHLTTFAPEMGIPNFDCAGVNADFRDGYAQGYVDCATAKDARLDDGGFAERFLEQMRQQRAAGCPEWCVLDHDPDDERDELALHMGDDHTDNTVRKLLAAHRCDIQVTRTDCPSEGRVGVPNLYVRCEVELTTWEQAAELARAILDGFGYLKGAEL